MRLKTNIQYFLICLTYCFFTLLSPVYAGAQKGSFIRTEIKQIETIYAGQRIPFYITLYSKTRFTGVPRFELPQISGMILMEIEDRPILGQAEEHGVEFLTKTHEFAAFAQTDGQFLIPAFTVSFEYMDNGQNIAIENTYTTTEMQINVTQPPGTEKITPLMATQHFSIQATWNPIPQKAKVGDAFKLTITRTAEDIPGMVFLPVTLKKINGLGIYENPPMVEDSMQRGDFTGKRTEIITYVCEKKGTYKIPKLSFHWFDLKSKELKTEQIAAVEIKVAPNPQYSKTNLNFKTHGNAFDHNIKLAVLTIIFISLAGFGLFWFRKPIRKQYTVWAQHRATSEKLFFRTFEKACQSNDNIKTLQALFDWMSRIRPDTPPVSVRESFARFHDPELLAALTALERQTYGDPALKNSDGPKLNVKLLDMVRQYRTHCLKTNKAPAKPNRLEPLNP